MITLVQGAQYLVQYHESADVYADIVIGSFKASFQDLDANAIVTMGQDPRVKRMESNKIMYASTVQEHPIWGLDRIDNRDALTDKYDYPDEAGNSVTAYIVDTGINVEHEDFGGRASWGFDATDEGEFDGNGHGTHVAGTIGSDTYGVAKEATLVAVKVLTSSGSGTNAGVLRGIEWVYKDAVSKGTAKSKKAVANMSLGGMFSQVINDAVKAAVDSGVEFVVAAGNERQDACSGSPSR